MSEAMTSTDVVVVPRDLVRKAAETLEFYGDSELEIGNYAIASRIRILVDELHKLIEAADAARPPSAS